MLTKSSSIGFLLFFINEFSDSEFDIPLAEIIFFCIFTYNISKQRTIISNKYLWNMVFFSFAIVVWCTITEYVLSDSVSNSFRTFVKLTFFYIGICLYALTPNKNYFFPIIAGFIAAYVINYFFFLFSSLSSDESMHTEGLKYILPTPAVIMCFIFVLKDNVSKKILYFLYLILFVLVLSTLLAGARGALLSLFVGAFSILLYKTILKNKFLFVNIILLVPFVSVFGAGLFYGEIRTILFNMDYITWSNTERLILLNESYYILFNQPFGVGSDNYITENFSLLVLDETGQHRFTAASPHNFYMEMSVPYGIFPLFFLIIFFRNLYNLFIDSVRGVEYGEYFAVFSMTVITWKMVYQPISGMQRIDAYIVIFCCLFFLQRKNIKFE